MTVKISTVDLAEQNPHIIAQEVVPIQLFNNLPVDYRFKVFFMITLQRLMSRPYKVKVNLCDIVYCHIPFIFYIFRAIALKMNLLSDSLSKLRNQLLI